MCDSSDDSSDDSDDDQNEEKLQDTGYAMMKIKWFVYQTEFLRSDCKVSFFYGKRRYLSQKSKNWLETIKLFTLSLFQS